MIFRFAQKEVIFLFDFDRFESLRKQYGVTKKFIADALDRTPAICQDWKYGKSEPNDKQIVIVAEILHTSPAYLRHETDDSEPTGANPASDDDLKFALFGGGDATDEMFAEVKAFAQFVKERERLKRGDSK